MADSKTVDIYVHADRDANYDKGHELGLDGEALHIFSFTGYEEKLTYEVDADGYTRLIAVNDRALGEYI